GLKTLHTLHLTRTELTAGLKELAGLQSLQTLILAGTKVTDGGPKELAGLQSLQELILLGTKVTDRGLKALAVLQSLDTPYLSHTHVTDGGVADVRMGLPKCVIIKIGQ